MATVYSWDQHADEIERRILSNVSPLKIGLKTKDDPYFLAGWLDHHLSIVGPQAIFIADNGSSDTEVTAIYGRLPEDTVIFRFHGLHNDLHDRRMFPQLHRALLYSSDFFQILDTDERLVWIEIDHYYKDERIVEKLNQQLPTECSLGIWLENIKGSKDRFKLGPIENTYSSLLWGKSLFASSRIMPLGQRLHNCQLPIGLQNQFTKPPHICILHLKNLSIEQRLRATRQKLLARNAASEAASLEEIARTDILPNALPGSQYYQTELSKLVSGEEPLSPTEAEIGNSITFNPDGTYGFENAKTKNLFEHLFIDSENLVRTAFSKEVNLNPK